MTFIYPGPYYLYSIIIYYFGTSWFRFREMFDQILHNCLHNHGMRERQRQKAIWRSISCCLYKVYILQVSPSMMAGHPGVFACSTWTSGVIYCFTARIQQTLVAPVSPLRFKCPCVFGALSPCQSNRRWWILLGAFVQHGKLASRSRNESLASLDQKGQKAKHFCWFMVNKAWNSWIPRSIKMLWRLWCQRLLKLTLQVIKLSSDFKIHLWSISSSFGIDFEQWKSES